MIASRSRHYSFTRLSSPISAPPLWTTHADRARSSRDHAVSGSIRLRPSYPEVVRKCTRGIRTATLENDIIDLLRTRLADSVAERTSYPGEVIRMTFVHAIDSKVGVGRRAVWRPPLEGAPAHCDISYDVSRQTRTDPSRRQDGAAGRRDWQPSASGKLLSKPQSEEFSTPSLSPRLGQAKMQNQSRHPPTSCVLSALSMPLRHGFCSTVAADFPRFDGLCGGRSAGDPTRVFDADTPTRGLPAS